MLFFADLSPLSLLQDAYTAEDATNAQRSRREVYSNLLLNVHIATIL